MEIDIIKLKDELVKIKKSIDDYEYTYINLYNLFSSSSFFWNDQNANSFFESIKKEKLENNIYIFEIKKLYECYNYIVNKYEYIGNKIKVDFKNSDKIINKLEKCSNKLSEIINLYNNLNIPIYNSMYSTIIIEQNKLKKNKVNIDLLITDIKNKLNYISELEKKISLMLSKIDIRLIIENEV